MNLIQKKSNFSNTKLSNLLHKCKFCIHHFFFLVRRSLRNSSRSFRFLLSPQHLRSLSHDLSVSRISFLSVVSSLLSSGFLGSLSLNSNSGDQSLDFGSLRSSFVFVVGGQISSDNEFGDIVFLVQVEKLSDFGSSFGTQSLVGNGVVGEAWDVGISSFDNDARNSGHVVIVDATSDGFPLSFTSSLRVITAGSTLQQQSLSLRSQNTLFHGETLLVFATSESDDVAFPFVTKGVEGNFVRDSFFEDVFVSVFVVDFDTFLLAGGRVGDVKFHVFVLKKGRASVSST